MRWAQLGHRRRAAFRVMCSRSAPLARPFKHGRPTISPDAQRMGCQTRDCANGEKSVNGRLGDNLYAVQAHDAPDGSGADVDVHAVHTSEIEGADAREGGEWDDEFASSRHLDGPARPVRVRFAAGEHRLKVPTPANEKKVER